jgi:hypothetical protein
MARENLVLDVNINPNGQPSGTETQLGGTSQFTSGFSNQSAVGLKNLALVGTIGLAGKRIFDTALGSVGQYTGRTDLQRSIDRGRKAISTVATVGGAFIINPALGAAALFKIGVDVGIDAVEVSLQRNIDDKEASYRSELRGNRINESRYR